MNTYNLTEIELTELLRKQRELVYNHARVDISTVKHNGEWIIRANYVTESFMNAPLPPLPLGAKKEDIQPVLRWVKASERSPKKTGEYIVRNDETHEKELAGYHKGIGWHTNSTEIIGHLEWLEELSPSKSSQKQSLIELMEADQRDGIYGVSDKGKDIPDRIQELYHELGNCNLKNFLSLWFSYPPKTEKEWMDKINNVLPCTCGDAYKLRDMAAPDCPQCNYADEVYMLVAPLLNSEQGVQVSDTTEPNSSTSPDPQNAQKEPVIDKHPTKILLERLSDKDKSLSEFYDLHDRFRQGFMMAEGMVNKWALEYTKPYLKSNSEPVIDWEGLEDGLYHLNIAEAWGPTDVVINWLKSNLTNYIKVK